MTSSRSTDSKLLNNKAATSINQTNALCGIIHPAKKALQVTVECEDLQVRLQCDGLQVKVEYEAWTDEEDDDEADIDSDEDEDTDEDEDIDEDEDTDEGTDGNEYTDLDSEEDDEEENESTVTSISQPAIDFKTEAPELAQWDHFHAPVAQKLLSRIPFEVWEMILSHVPPCRLARLLPVSKGWKSMIENLILWKDIATNCHIGDSAFPASNHMQPVLGHMVVICDLCLQRSYQFGSDIPLPVRRPDLLGLTWMCKNCRRWYRAAHPEVMSEQGPCVKVTRAQTYRRSHWQPERLDDLNDFDGYGENDEDYEDDEAYEDDEDYEGDENYEDYEDYGDYEDSKDYGSEVLDSDQEHYYQPGEWRPTWRNRGADEYSWLNQVLCRGRERMLRTMLAIYGLEIRPGSRLCTDFIEGTPYDPDKIVKTMRELTWYFKHTNYPRHNRFGQEKAKIRAIAAWCEEFESMEGLDSIPEYKAHKNAPPEPLWPMVDLAFGVLTKYWEKQYRIEEAHAEFGAQVAEAMIMTEDSSDEDDEDEEDDDDDDDEDNDSQLETEDDGSQRETEDDSDETGSGAEDPYDDLDPNPGTKWDDWDDDEDEEVYSSEEYESGEPSAWELMSQAVRDKMRRALTRNFDFTIDCAVEATDGQ
ncbi:hypothetical protein BGZ54_001007 [Gamsiella multidivaricata]|nr:hypothetical protein BGZ54_001007 [Gamsiella multidivaricata]